MTMMTAEKSKSYTLCYDCHCYWVILSACQTRDYSRSPNPTAVVSERWNILTFSKVISLKHSHICSLFAVFMMPRVYGPAVIITM